jgi:hypothetical protein
MWGRTGGGGGCSSSLKCAFRRKLGVTMSGWCWNGEVHGLQYNITT